MFTYSLFWGLGADGVVVSEGWDLGGGEPSIHILTYSHTETVKPTLTLALKTPESTSSLALGSLGLVALVAGRRMRRRRSPQ